MASKLPPTIPSIFQPDIQSIELTIMDLPTPLPKHADDHIINVYATSPCSGELLWGKYFPGSLFAKESSVSRLLVPCYDLAGVVVQAPVGSPFPVGSEVYTRTSATRSGNARPYTIARTSELAHKPQNLSWEEAASVPLSTFTAVQALFEHGELSPLTDVDRIEKNRDKKLLVTGAAGGVGVWIMQLAREAGIGTIVGVAGTSNVDFAKSLGATNMIDYRETSIKEWANTHPDIRFDVVLDCIGSSTLEQAWYVVKNGGKLISISGMPEQAKPADATATDVQSVFFIMEPKGEQLVPVTQLLEAGRVRPIVDSVWEFDQYQQAFEKLQTGHARGKIIIRVPQ